MANYNKTIDEFQKRIAKLNETKDKLLETVHKIGDEITYNAHVINLFAYHKDQIEEIIMNWCVKNKLSYNYFTHVEGPYFRVNINVNDGFNHTYKFIYIKYIGGRDFKEVKLRKKYVSYDFDE